MNVGTRELKNRLSHYLRRIREDGDSVYVTDRGTVVAELRPVATKRESDRAVLAALSAKGEVTSGSGRFTAFKPIKPRAKGSVSRLVLDDRG
jgi:prevent-host-death family protein